MRTVALLGALAVLLTALVAANSLLVPRVDVAAMAREGGDTPVERDLARIAQRISGREEVGVRCGDTGDPSILGTVAFYGGRPGKETVLAAKVCTTLATLASGAAPPSLACTQLGRGTCGADVVALSWATTALAHESFHLAGVRDEAAAECYGLQATALVATSLGAPPAYAAVLANYTFWNVRPPVDGGYFSPECRDGGALDLRPSDPVWP